MDKISIDKVIKKKYDENVFCEFPPSHSYSFCIIIGLYLLKKNFF